MPIIFNPIENSYLFDGWDVNYLARINNFRPIKPTKASDVEAAAQLIVTADLQQKSRKIILHLFNEGNIQPSDILNFAFFFCDKSVTPPENWWVPDIIGPIP